MRSAEEFDEFYVSTRRRLLLQTLALTGDLSVSRSAVRDAYVAARHHWGKVSRLDDPESWVRPRAWSIAQRRGAVRPRHRERDAGPEQAAVLEALARLSDGQRKALLLTHLAGVPVTDIGREIGETRDRTTHLLHTAISSMALSLDCDRAELRDRLELLGAMVERVRLPRAPIIRRSGLRRRRNHLLAGSVLAVATTIGAGALVAPGTGADKPPSPPVRTLVSRSMLLSAPQLAPLAGRGQAWRVTGTSDNTGGTGLNTMCQTTRFADPHGIGAWVRTFATPAPVRGLVQTVEISETPGAARDAYDNTLRWYAGCSTPRIQLIDAYDVRGLGEQATILRMRIPDPRQTRSFLVGIARTGALTTSTVLETHDAGPPPATSLTGALATSVRDLCGSKVAGPCVSSVSTVKALPPPSGEAKGMLAIADLPAVASVSRPWAGTDPVPATTNVAATTCDRADFAKSGAASPMTRTFLVPQAGLPARFGISETLGRFRDAATARRFVDVIVKRMRTCPKRELSSTVSKEIVRNTGGDSGYALWRLENEVNQQEKKVGFWMGIVRVGRDVAQVNLTPVGKYDVAQPTFHALVQRARERLLEDAQ